MKLTIEFTENKQKILIVDKDDNVFTNLLRKKLEKYENQIYLSPVLPQNLSIFSICFFINPSKKLINELDQYRNIKFICVFTGKPKLFKEFVNYITTINNENLKGIHIVHDPFLTEDEFEQFLWFSLSPQQERILEIYTKGKKEVVHEEPFVQDDIKPYISRRGHWIIGLFSIRNIPLIILSLIFIGHILFIPPLIAANIFYYQGVVRLYKHEFLRLPSVAQPAHQLLTFSKKSYSIFRPTYLLLSLASFPDSVLEIDGTVDSILQKSIPLHENATKLLRLLMQKNKTAAEVQETSDLLSQVNADIDDLGQNLEYLSPKIPTFHSSLKDVKNEISDILTLINTTKKILPHFDSLFAKTGTKKYLILLEDNTILRPGGGLVSTVGILTVEQYTLKDFQVYDVDSIDKQLPLTINPPEPIKRYTEANSWFLKDVAFSPDTIENDQNALKFVKDELHEENFNGVAVLTLTSLQNILSSIGTIEVPGVKEKVNQDNLLVKAQIYSDPNAAINKSLFLSAVLKEIFNNLNSIHPIAFASMLKKSLDEKQIMLSFNDASLQKNIDDLYWAGRLFTPTCTVKSDNCIVDYIFPIDANFTPTLSNEYITKSITQKVTFSNDNTIKNQLTIKVQNQSFEYPNNSGIYKNFFQVLLPKDSTIKYIAKNNTLLDTYTVVQDTHKRVQIYLEVKPHTQDDIHIDYELKMPAVKKSVYQLILQKQPGAPNYDFDLKLEFQKGIYAVNQNFSPLVKDNLMLYNTSITSDKIFFVELLRDNL